MVLDRHRKIGEDNGLVTANNIFRHFRSIHNFTSAAHGELPPNPVAILTQARAWNAERRRRSVVPAHGLPKWWRAVHQEEGYVRDFKVDRRSCVIALTHDPKLDDLALLEALNTDAFYVGAIGSRRNNEARHTRMIEHFEQTPDNLARLRGPIGIYIGSKTPPEIAVSIMAEVLAIKNGVSLPRTMGVANAKNALIDGRAEPSGLTCFSAVTAR